MIMCASCVTRSAFPPRSAALWHSVTVPAAFDFARNQPRRPHLEWWRQSLQCWCLRQHQNISHSIRPVPVPLVNDALTLNNMLTYVTVASSLVDSTFQYFHDLPWFIMVIMICCCSGLISLSPMVYRTDCVLPTLDLGDRTQYNLSDALPGLVEDLSLAQPSTRESRPNGQSITGNWMSWMHLDALRWGRFTSERESDGETHQKFNVYNILIIIMYMYNCIYL